MSAPQPLAARMRPTSLDEIVGQDHLIFPGSPLQLLTDGKTRTSVLLWAPPGTGKTSIADVVARTTSQHFVELSATSAGVKQVREQIDEAKKHREEDGTNTVLFLDEIHRFSKAQQDILLPAVESGVLSLIGATTENPSFSVISALVSRSILMVLRPLDNAAIMKLLQRAIDDPRGLDGNVTASEATLELIADLASGDARQALNRLEICAETVLARGDTEITAEIVELVTGAALQRFDRDGDQHYDIISAFIKSMRGSDPDATLYWLARMIEAGEDPRYIARRIMIHASEDVGMADPSVLPVAVAAAQATQLVGMPEAQIILAHAAVAVATAPKSPASCSGIGMALEAVKHGATDEVPKHLRDSHYPGAKLYGHGEGYLWPHDFPGSVVSQEYLPPRLAGTKFYQPTANGYEQTVAQRMGAIQQFLKENGR